MTTLKILASFSLQGDLPGGSHLKNGKLPAAMRLYVLEDSTLVGVVRQSNGDPWDDELVFRNGRAVVDLFHGERMSEACSARFQLLRVSDQEATVVDCVARISRKYHGLKGKWTSGDSSGAFTMQFQDASRHPQSSALDTLKKLSSPDDVVSVVAAMNRPATYFLEGVATSDNGVAYESTLKVTLTSDGLLTGESVEKYADSQRCLLNGKWTEQAVEYTLSYFDVKYKYTGTLSDDRLHLVGHWEIEDDERKLNGNNRGRFEFVVTGVVDESNAETASLPASDATEPNDVKQETETLPLDAFSVGEFVFDGEAIGDNQVVYNSVLTLKLADDQTLTGTSTEKSVAPQVCLLKGSWSEHEVTYNLSYTDGCTATYTYRGKIEDNKLVGRWENDDEPSRQSSAETGQFTFSLTRRG